MATETVVEQKAVEAAEPPLASVAVGDDVAEVKTAVTHPTPLENKALALPDDQVKKTSGGSNDRDIALAQVGKDKTASFIKAWEESEKSKVENKAQKKKSAVDSWENSKKASLEAKLRKLEEQLEKKKAEYGEQIKNKMAMIHKEAEEKRAMAEEKRRLEVLRADELSAKYRATGYVPKKFLGCIG